jgi:hypothetical protein
VPGINRDEQDPQKFHVDWQAVHAGLNPWKRSEKVIIDPYLVAKAIKGVMRQCTQQTATGKPLVWNDYAVFMDLNDWEQVKKLEATLTRDLGAVVTRTLKKSKAEMVGPLNVRLLRDEGNVVRPNTAIIKVDFRPEEKLEGISGADASEMTVRIGGLVAKSVTDLTQRVPDMEGLGVQDDTAPEQLRLSGASSKINKRQLWVEADEDGALIGRLSDANPVEVNGRLLQAGGQISIEDFPAQISLSSGELTLTLERIEPS